MRIPVSLVSPKICTNSSPGNLLLPLFDYSKSHFLAEQQPSSPVSSILSDPPQPSNKRRRISVSSLSAADDDDDDDEEDRPLAARMSLKTSTRAEKSTRPPASKRSGKTRGKASHKAHTAPASLLPPSELEKSQINGGVNGVNGHVNGVKVEDVMDQSQLSRLAAGVTVDTGSNAPAGVRSSCNRLFYPCLMKIHSLQARQRKLLLLKCAVASFKSHL